MPTGKLNEKFSGRRSSLAFNAEQVEVTYYVHGSPDELDAKAVLLASAPATWPGQKGTLVAKNWEVIETNSSLGRHTGTVTYELPDWGPKNTGEEVFTFDTTGGTQHIDYSKATSARYPSGTGTASAPDLAGAINASQNGIAGADITIPNFAFSATKYYASTSVTSTYIATLYQLTGTTNDATWNPTIDGITLNLLEGEGLYLGATGSRRGIGDVEITHHFGASQNVTSLTVGSITGISKKGWELLWVRPENQTFGTGSNAIVASVAKYVYIEKVYDEASFTGLGL